jgi:hypothetical protein
MALPEEIHDCTEYGQGFTDAVRQMKETLAPQWQWCTNFGDWRDCSEEDAAAAKRLGHDTRRVWTEKPE